MPTKEEIFASKAPWAHTPEYVAVDKTRWMRGNEDHEPWTFATATEKSTRWNEELYEKYVRLDAWDEMAAYFKWVEAHDKKTIKDLSSALALMDQGLREWGEGASPSLAADYRSTAIAVAKEAEVSPPSRAEPDFRELRELVHAMFIQACATDDNRYDHSCLQIYELAQEQLLKWKMIKKEDCVRS